jgi:hypothetical protein
MRDENGKFIKGHPPSGVRWTKERYEKMKDYLFKKGNKIRNTGRTRFKVGHRESKETKVKRSKSMLGNKNCVGKEPWNKGKIGYSILSTRKENHWNWKGGITSLNQKLRKSLMWELWRKTIFERDNYTCRKCRVQSGFGRTIHLHPHHIINLSTCLNQKLFHLIFNLNNGLTLCEDCHKEIHKNEQRITC